MYFNLGKGFTIVFTLVLFMLTYRPIVVKANEHQDKAKLEATTLTAQPKQCVTLRQGRKCFANIHLQWKTPSKQNICLFQAGQQQKIKCWQNHDNAEMIIEFESNESINYQLRRLTDNKIIAQTQIKVSWLHKGSARKRRWRLF
jgi:hypothetical protein